MMGFSLHHAGPIRYRVSGGHLAGPSEYGWCIRDECGYVAAICNDRATAGLLRLGPELVQAVMQAIADFGEGECEKDIIYRLQKLEATLPEEVKARAAKAKEE